MFFYVFAVWQWTAVTHVAERESNVTNEDSTSERKEVINHDTVGSHRSNVSERHEIKHYGWVIWQKKLQIWLI